MTSKLDFLSQFDHLSELIPAQGKARAVIHNGLDFPTTRDEYWKYTRVSPLVEAEYQRNEVSLGSIDPYRVPDLDAHYLVFVNGLFQPSLSDASLPNGVHASSMKQTDGARRELMLSHLDQYVDSEHQAFQALNTSYFEDGAFITIDNGIHLSKPIVILHVSAGKKQVSNVRNLILVGQNANAQFIAQYEGDGNDGAFTNMVSEVCVEQGGDASFYLVQNEGESASHISTTQVVQERDSTSKVFTLTKSGKLVRNNLNFTVKGEGCESNMYGIYFTKDRQHVDNHTYVDHLVSNCNSNELYKGVMSDRSTGVFNGKIMVHKDAQQTNAFQSNQNILLSDNASINTKPELEIYADDVKCSHGCTIGQLDEEAMFYLRSRGLGKEAAARMLVQAFAGDVVEHIDIDPLRAFVQKFIQEKFEVDNA